MQWEIMESRSFFSSSKGVDAKFEGIPDGIFDQEIFRSRI
jgi:hypothetical protein